MANHGTKLGVSTLTPCERISAPHVHVRVWGRNSFTRDKLVDIVVCSVGSQAPKIFPPEISALPQYMGQDYEENGVGEKPAGVGLNRLSSRKMGERLIDVAFITS